MNKMIFLLFIILLQIVQICSVRFDSSSESIQSRILNNYERKHRPVKKESTVTNVRVLMMVNHIEQIDEKEQTMLVHGILWSSWKDEYLQWDPAKFNNTRWIQIPAWRLWQPALALYNSARANSWYLYMNGQPYGVSSDGSVVASGVFSFHVTCGFDFSAFPNDVQKCPIVIVDWLYDLSKVNLTNGAYSRTSSIVRLSTNPFGGEQKKHVGGWEVVDSYEKVCYYGPYGCEKDPSSQYPLSNFWSMIEFGIELKRHAPYFFSTIQLPIVLSAILALFTFWIENLNVAVGICLSAMMLESFTGYSLLKMLPPSTNHAPKIVYCYSYTFIIGLAILSFHVGLIFVSQILPEDVEFNFHWTALTDKLRKKWPFKTAGFNFVSFDPENLIDIDSTKSQENLQDPHQNINPNFQSSDNDEDGNTIIQLESLTPENLSSKSSSENSLSNHLLEAKFPNDEPSTSAATSIIHLGDEEFEQKSPKTSQERLRQVSRKKELTHLEQELYTLRRICFFVVSFVQFIIIVCWLI